MRNQFNEFYPISPMDEDKIWEEALIVLDTNVLLNIYRFPNRAREEFLSILESISERLFIPFHAALEFQRNRPTVIFDKKKNIESFKEAASASLTKLKDDFSRLEIAKNVDNSDEAKLFSALDAAYEALIVAAGSVSTAFQGLSSEDQIRDRLDKITQGRVGLGPENQSDLDKLVSDSQTRYEHSIPPGFKDKGKSKKDGADSFYHRDIKYELRHGDLIIWRQIIEKARLNKSPAIILVTDDKKEDWWWEVNGRTLGPHPSLSEELSREAGVNLYWQYSSASFVRQASTKLRKHLSPHTIKEIENVSNEKYLKIRYSKKNLQEIYRNQWKKRQKLLQVDRTSLEALPMMALAESQFPELQITGEYPDMISSEPSLQAFQFLTSHEDKKSFEKSFLMEIKHALSWLKDNQPSRLTLAIHMDISSMSLANKLIDLAALVRDEFSANLKASLTLAIGTTSEDGTYEPWYWEGNEIFL